MGEMGLAYIRYYPGICMEQLTKTVQNSVRMDSSLVAIEMR
jgi:hypothetical protein